MMYGCKMECYVCTEECYTLSPCKCMNLALCNDCYAKLLVYGNKKCSICLEEFPVIEENTDEDSVEEDRSDKLNPLWIFFPIMMRPHPHTTFPDCHRFDACVDIFRHIVFVFFYCLLYEIIFRPNQMDISNPLMFAFVIHVILCICIRHACAKKYVNN